MDAEAKELLALAAGAEGRTDLWRHDVRIDPTLVFPYAVQFAEAMDLLLLALSS